MSPLTSRFRRCGFTLVEVLVASSVLALMALALLEGIIVSSRIAHENAQLLQAEAIAWDAAWKRFNEDYSKLVVSETTGWRDLPEAAAPGLQGYDVPPKLIVRVENASVPAGWLSELKVVVADVEWGPSSRRHKLSDGGHEARVFRSDLRRAP